MKWVMRERPKIAYDGSFRREVDKRDRQPDNPAH